MRLDHTLPGGPKYLMEQGCRHLFFPPTTLDVLRDSATIVVIVEAEKSSLALHALGDRTGRNLLPIAIGGCWGWRRKVGKRELPNGGGEPETGPSSDLDLIVWKGRRSF